MPTMTFASPTISSSDSSWCGYSGRPRSAAQAENRSNSSPGSGVVPGMAQRLTDPSAASQLLVAVVGGHEVGEGHRISLS